MVVGESLQLVVNLAMWMAFRFLIAVVELVWSTAGNDGCPWVWLCGW